MKYKVDKLMIEYSKILGIPTKKNIVYYRNDKDTEWLYFCKKVEQIIYHGDIMNYINEKKQLIISPMDVDKYQGKKLEVNIIDGSHKLVIKVV